MGREYTKLVEAHNRVNGGMEVFRSGESIDKLLGRIETAFQAFDARRPRPPSITKLLWNAFVVVFGVTCYSCAFVPALLVIHSFWYPGFSLPRLQTTFRAFKNSKTAHVNSRIRQVVTAAGVAGAGGAAAAPPAPPAEDAPEEAAASDKRPATVDEIRAAKRMRTVGHALLGATGRIEAGQDRRSSDMMAHLQVFIKEGRTASADRQRQHEAMMAEVRADREAANQRALTQLAAMMYMFRPPVPGEAAAFAPLMIPGLPAFPPAAAAAPLGGVFGVPPAIPPFFFGGAPPAAAPAAVPGPPAVGTAPQ